MNISIPSCPLLKTINTQEKSLTLALSKYLFLLACLLFMYTPMVAQEIIDNPESRQEVLQNKLSQQESSERSSRMAGNRPKLILTQEVIASDRTRRTSLGSSVAIYKNIAVVGAQFESKDENGLNGIFSAGAAYIYEQDSSGNWIEIQKIVAPDRKQGPQFGHSVAIYKNFIVVGANTNSRDENGANFIENAGGAYIFKRTIFGEWIFIQKIVAADPTPQDVFGSSIAISDGLIAVGAPGQDEDEMGDNTLSGAGAAYFYELDVVLGIWSQVYKAVASDRSSGAEFGTSIAISEGTVVIGAPEEAKDENGENTLNQAGAAYIFQKDTQGTWNEQQKLVSSDRTSGDNFGTSVAISGKDLIIGAPLEDEDAQGNNVLGGAGSAYIFAQDDLESWGEAQKIVPIGRKSGDRFGESVAIFGNRVLGGAPGDSLDEDMVNTIIGSGAIQAFGRNPLGNWISTQRLKISDPEKFDSNGQAIALYGKYAISGTSAYNLEIDENDKISFVGLVSFYDTTRIAEPEITVASDLRIIASGDTTPTEIDNTSFGATTAPETRTFTIDNTLGNADLILTEDAPNFVTLSGSPDFTISSQPVSGIIPAGGAVSFEVMYTPTIAQEQNAVVSISNNDRTENPYTFAVSGVLENSITLNPVSQTEKFITIYPVPVKSILSIDVKSDIRIEKLFIYNVVGTLVTEDIFGLKKAKTLNIQHLPTGHYFLHLHTVKGEIITRHFIKE